MKNLFEGQAAIADAIYRLQCSIKAAEVASSATELQSIIATLEALHADVELIAYNNRILKTVNR